MRTVRSDELPKFLEMMSTGPFGPYVMFSPPQPFHLVVDCGTALNAVRWKVGRPGVRVPIEEVSASGVAVFYAPHFIEEEVAKNLPLLSDRYGLPLERMKEAWLEFRSGLVLCHPKQRLRPHFDRLRARDPKDIPYAEVAEDVGADAILGGDCDFDETELRRLGHEVIQKVGVALRDVARAKAREAEIRFGTTGVVGFGVMAIAGAGKLAAKIPWWGYAIMLIAGGAWLADPKRREKALDKAKDVVGNAFRKVSELNAEADEAEAESAVHLCKVIDAIAAPCTPNLDQSVFRAAANARSPVDATAIAARLAKSFPGASAKTLTESLEVELRRQAKEIAQPAPRASPRNRTAPKKNPQPRRRKTLRSPPRTVAVPRGASDKRA